MQAIEQYYLFEGGDIVGPFSVRELLSRAGFGAHSLVCPSEHSEEGDYWREASYYSEFGFPNQPKEPLPTPTSSSVEKKEISRPITQRSEAPSQQEQPMSVPLSQMPAQPIETITTATSADKAELTLPVLPQATSSEQASAISAAAETPDSLPVDTKIITKENPIERYFNTMREGDLGNILGIPDETNSDLNLIRAVEQQFERTDPSTAPPAHLEKDPFDDFTSAKKQTETFPPAVDEVDRQTQAALTQGLQALQQDNSLSLKNAEKIPAVSIPTLEPTAPPISPATDKQSGFGKFVRGALVCLVGLTVLGVGGYFWADKGHILSKLRAKIHTTLETPAQPQVPVPVPAPVPVPNAPRQAEMPEATLEQQAQDIVKHYVLDQNRGSIEEYLTKRHAAELASGYTAMWVAEPLHRNAYVVRYRLVKARQEPIVYVFQADTSKKKLTGALNNITLDLIGKINL